MHSADDDVPPAEKGVESGESGQAGDAVEARLQLQQSPQLIDDAFIFIRRTENGTQFVEHSPQLLKRLERCFYRSPAAALDLCEHGNVVRQPRKAYLIRFLNNILKHF